MGKLTYTVTKNEDGFVALLGQRDIAAVGATEHEAITGLLNYVAELCASGQLDETGEPLTVSPITREGFETVVRMLCHGTAAFDADGKLRWTGRSTPKLQAKMDAVKGDQAPESP